MGIVVRIARTITMYELLKVTVTCYQKRLKISIVGLTFRYIMLNRVETRSLHIDLACLLRHLGRW